MASSSLRLPLRLLRRRLGLLGVVSTLLGAAPASAQVTSQTSVPETTASTGTAPRGTLEADAGTGDGGTPVTSSPVELEAVVVSATKSAVVASEAPAAVTVVSSARMDERNVSRLGDALARVPSVYLQGGALGQSHGSTGSSGMSLRGIDQRKTLILIDGQPLQDANSGSVNWRAVQTEDIERVEVVPGPFSSLYGSNAIGGVVNVITKQPDRRERTVKVRQGWGDANGTNVSAYLRERLTTGLGVAAGVTYGTHGSFINEFVVRQPDARVTPETPVTGAIPTTTTTGQPAFIVGDKGATPWTQLNATAKLSYEPAPGHRLSGGVAYATSETGSTYFHTYLRSADGGVPVSSGKTLDVEGQGVSLGENNFVNSSPIVETNARIFAGYEGLFADAYVVKVDAAHVERGYRFGTVGASSSFGSGPGDLTEAPNGAFDATASLSFPVGAYNDVIAGLSTHLDYLSRRVSSLSNWRDHSTTAGLKSGADGQSQTYSLFVQDEVSIPVQAMWKVYLGARVDRWQTIGRFFQNTAPVQNAAYARRGEWAFSPKLSTVLKPVEALTFRGSVGRSFRAPTNLDLYSTAVISSGLSPTGYATTQADPNLSPERSTSWEVGGEWRWRARSELVGLVLGVTYYENHLENLIASKTVDRSLTQRINAGSAIVRGVELAATAQLFTWFDVSASYTWVGSRVTKNDADPDSVGKRLAQSPEHLLNVAADFRYRPVTATIALRRISHVFQNSQNTDRTEHVPGAYDAYAMVDAKVAVEVLQGTRLALAVNNLLDQQVYAYYLLPRRNVTAELTVSF